MTWAERNAAAMAGFEGARREMNKRAVAHEQLQREVAALASQRDYLAEKGDTAGLAQAQQALVDRQGRLSTEYDAFVEAELGRDEFAAQLDAIQAETTQMPRRGVTRW
jgi:hypothetical protein